MRHRRYWRSGADEARRPDARRIYAHFASLETLIEAVISEMFADSAQRSAAVLHLEDPAERLNQWIDRYLSEQHCGAPGECCPIPALVSEIAHLPPDAQALFSAKREALRRQLVTA